MTWLRQILKSGSEIMINKVKRFINNYRNKKSAPKNRRHDDTYLVSYPKSGNTWVSFLISNAIIEYLNLDMDVNFFNIHDFVPDIHISREINNLYYENKFPRVIKSHSSFNPFYNKVFLLFRDPKDIMVSYYHFKKNMNSYNKNLSDFIRDDKFGVDSWVDHSESWLNNCYPSQRLNLFFYEDFKDNPNKELKRMFNLLGYNFNSTIIESAVEKSSLENMKIIENKTASYSLKKLEKFKFVRKGKKGQGKAELSSDDKNYINEQTTEVLTKLKRY